MPKLSLGVPLPAEWTVFQTYAIDPMFCLGADYAQR